MKARLMTRKHHHRAVSWPTRIELGALCSGLIGVAGLYALHWQMDAMLDPGNKQVRDEAVDYFYPFHKGYLIVSTVLWFIGLVHFVLLTAPSCQRRQHATSICGSERTSQHT